MATIVGVFREAEFSPGRVEDDAAILERTADALRRRGHEVRLGTAALALAGDVDAVLAMCQSAPALATIDAAERRHVPVMNSAGAIRNCFRTETVRLLHDAGLPVPTTDVVATDAPPPALAPCWVKRGDVHAMDAGDVTFAPDCETLVAAVAALRDRGIARAVLQAHVDGPVVKFYGVASGEFFRCYSEREYAPAAVDRLAEAAFAGAAALGLDVFGGDLVVSPAGVPMLIDVNDWPSFARCRDDAAEAIAAHVLAARTRPTPEERTYGAANRREDGVG
jgi:hypothetical protein